MSKITQSARNEECTLRLPGICNYDPATTVWCHSNRGKDGKGMGLKSRDDNGAYGCSACHSVYDRQRPRPKNMTLDFVESRFTEAMRISRQILVDKGLLNPENPCANIDSVD